MDIVLAYDLAPNNVGYAAGPMSREDRWPVDFGYRTMGIGSIGTKMRRFANMLYADLERWKPTKLVLESPLPPQAQTDTWTAIKIYGQYCYVHEACDRRNIGIPSGASASTIRSDLACPIAQGDKQKKLVVGFVRAFGLDVTNHNTADACMVWIWYRMQLLGMPPVAGPLFRREMS